MDNIELKLIVDYVEDVSKEDIKAKNRKPNIVFLRVVYALLALKYTNETLKSIGNHINRDHATIMHYRDKLSEEVLSNEFYLDMFNSYSMGKIPNLLTTSKHKFKRILVLCGNLRTENRKLKKKIEDNIIPNDYTDNELKYRLLSPGEQKIYNERVQPILKMMPSNQKRKEVFEVITCQS